MNAPFERIVSEHSATVLRVCRAVLPPSDADDAWSETFLAALGSYPSLPEGSNVQAWLVTIAHRKAIDIVRARQRHAIPVEEVPDRPSALGDPEAVEHDLYAALRRLPDKQRHTVAYHYLGGMPYDEIAKTLGGTAAAARRAAADGIRTLRTIYAGTLPAEARASGTTDGGRP